MGKFPPVTKARGGGKGVIQFLAPILAKHMCIIYFNMLQYLLLSMVLP